MKRNINLPVSFVLNRHKWTVELVEDDRDIMEGEDRCHGLTDPTTRTIEILARLGPHRRVGVFFHEFLHVVEFEYKIKIPHWLIYKLERPLSYIFFMLLNVQ